LKWDGPQNLVSASSSGHRGDTGNRIYAPGIFSGRPGVQGNSFLHWPGAQNLASGQKMTPKSQEFLSEFAHVSGNIQICGIRGRRPAEGRPKAGRRPAAGRPKAGRRPVEGRPKIGRGILICTWPLGTSHHRNTDVQCTAKAS
jgi:hypothetical protein